MNFKTSLVLLFIYNIFRGSLATYASGDMSFMFICSICGAIGLGMIIGEKKAEDEKSS